MPSATAVRQARIPIGRTYRECPLCDSRHLEYAFLVEKTPVCTCVDCGLLFLNPQPGDSSPGEIPPSETTVHESSGASRLTEVYRANAAERIQQLIEYSGIENGNLALIGTDPHLRKAAEKRGFDVHSVAPHELESAEVFERPESIDACILFCALERMKEPYLALCKIRQALKADGCLMVVSPTTDSKAARLFKASWWEFNHRNLYYFSVDTLQSILVRAGFSECVISPDRSLVSLNYLQRRLASSSRALRRYAVLRRLISLTPVLRDKAFRLLYGRTTFLARAKAPSTVPLLSVIIPAYNEHTTFTEIVEQVLAKKVEGVDLEIVVVESNSTDGTRQLALAYLDHPRVQLVLEDRPLGKGHAVRTGLRVAKGDLMLVQDADLEYDINDYDALLAPLLNHQVNFVLGSRHKATKNSWKIREFVDSPALAMLFNFGHLLFLTLFNLMYRQQLSDPFTMFKVFRRECIAGLSFECNRFDFDYELVIKLLRKGYKPLELPVNYRSRSKKEGKKVTLIRDPITWIAALVKFRHKPLYPSKPARP